MREPGVNVRVGVHAVEDKAESEGEVKVEVR